MGSIAPLVKATISSPDAWSLKPTILNKPNSVGRLASATRSMLGHGVDKGFCIIDRSQILVMGPRASQGLPAVLNVVRANWDWRFGPFLGLLVGGRLHFTRP